VSRLRLRLCCALPLLLAAGAHAERPSAASNVIVVIATRPTAGPHAPAHVHRPRRDDRQDAPRLPVCGQGGPASAYSAASGVAFAGRMDKVTFQANRTILVVRDGSNETCAYLPSRAELSRRGLPPALLRLRRPVMIEGFAHRTDKGKVLVQQLVVRPR
jgi:hypothetical protein